MEPVSESVGSKNPAPRPCQAWREMLLLECAFGKAQWQTGAEAAALRQHMAHCPGCRAYGEALQSLGGALQRLADSPLEPSPRLHARWTAAVRSQAGRPALVERAIDWVQAARFAVARNLKPIAALAPIWLLILIFRVTAPPAGAEPSAPSQSPLAIVRLLKLEQRQWQLLLARSEPAETKRHDGLLRPRSQLGAPAPSRRAFREQDFQTWAALRLEESPSNLMVA